MRYSICVLLVVCLATTVVSAAPPQLFRDTAGPSEIDVSIGKRTVLIPNGQSNLHHIPDQAISILSERPLTYLLAGCGGRTRLMAGTTFADSRPIRVVLEPSRKDGEPDRDYAGISTVFVSEKRVFGLYHAEDDQDMEKNPKSGAGGFYGSICLAEGGLKDLQFVKRGAVITSHRPKMVRGWEIEGGPRGVWRAQGVANPTVCLDPTSRYLHCYYNELSERRQRGGQICMARCLVSDRGQPGKWRKWFEDGFDEPGLAGRDTPVIWGNAGVNCVQASVQRIKAWDRFIIVFGVNITNEYHADEGRPEKSGLYLATSVDGIHWREPQQIMQTFCIFHRGREANVHPTLVLKRVEDDAASGMLICGHTPQWPTPHCMVGYSITLKPRWKSPRP